MKIEKYETGKDQDQDHLTSLRKTCYELEIKNTRLKVQQTETENINKQITAKNVILEKENQDLKIKIYDLENQLKSRFELIEKSRAVALETEN